MAALSPALIERDVVRLPAHATVGEALATTAVSPSEVVAVVDGDLFVGLVRGTALHHHVRHSPDERTSMAHVCELLDAATVEVPPTVDADDLLTRLLAEGADAAAVIDDGRLVGVVVVDDLRPRSAPR